MSSEFQSRLLYKQKSSAVINEEEPVTVSSTIYAIRYLYPGASQHTTNRIRITCTYRESDRFEAHAGVIERWSDKGWLLMDDYTDDVLAFHSEDEFRKRMLDYTQSFVLGIPLSVIDQSYLPESAMSSNPRKDNTPKRLFNFDQKETIKTEKTKPKQKDNYNTSSSKKDDDDDDDLDWL